jgi:hypothetical protein
MLSIAQEAAAVLVWAPEIEKRSKLREITQLNPIMGDLVRSQIEEQRNAQDKDSVMQGRQQVQEQQGQGPPQ